MPGSGGLTKALAQESKVSQSDCQKVLAALNKLAVKELQANGSFKIPKIVVVEKKATPAKQERIQNIFGSMKKVAAKPESCRLRAIATKQLKDAVLAEPCYPFSAGRGKVSMDTVEVELNPTVLVA